MNGEHALVLPSAVTPLTYLAEIAAMSWRHGGELAVAVGCAAVMAVTALGMHSLLPLPALAAILLIPASAAAWRLHRRQRTALATTRSLLVLNAGDRVDFERQVHARQERREARVEGRHSARLERLANEITSLQTAVLAAKRA